MKRFLSQWRDALAAGSTVAVATVLNGLGSRPRENGAQMLVLPTGETVDTVGGGRLEADVIECAKRVLIQQTSMLHHFDLSGQDASGTDMICGGTGDVLIYHSGCQDVPVLDSMLAHPEMNGWLLYPLYPDKCISFLPEDDAFGWGKHAEEARPLDIGRDFVLLERESGRCLAQRLKTAGRLHILGAGHVAVETAKVAQLAGMDCVVYDDRASFLNGERFPGARRVLLDDMARPPEAEFIKEDMIAIVTRGHLYDMECLAWALHTRAGYIGMIGSRRKSAMILDALLKKGYEKCRILQVHTPIGLDIGAQTPSEIAVSIMAELIAFRHGKLVPKEDWMSEASTEFENDSSCSG